MALSVVDFEMLPVEFNVPKMDLHLLPQESKSLTHYLQARVIICNPSTHTQLADCSIAALVDMVTLAIEPNAIQHSSAYKLVNIESTSQ